MAAAVECHQIIKEYGSGGLSEKVLQGVSLRVESGEACLLMGPSGSGKSTLLSILGCMLTPTSGRLTVAGQAVPSGSSAAALAALRARRLGFVFQHAQLLPFLNVQDNLLLAGRNAGVDRSTLDERIGRLMRDLDIEATRFKRPRQLSGGQRQRAAVARSLLNAPSLLLADEPTAALDWNSAQAVVRLLVDQARGHGAGLVAVTHDPRLIPHFDRVLEIDSGVLRERRA